MVDHDYYWETMSDESLLGYLTSHTLKREGEDDKKTALLLSEAADCIRDKSPVPPYLPDDLKWRADVMYEQGWYVTSFTLAEAGRRLGERLETE